MTCFSRLNGNIICIIPCKKLKFYYFVTYGVHQIDQQKINLKLINKRVELELICKLASVPLKTLFNWLILQGKIISIILWIMSQKE